MRTWRKIIILVMLLFFAAGLAVFLYPYIQGAIADHEIKERAQDVLEWIESEQTPPDTVNFGQEETLPESSQRDHMELWEAMIAYNETIWEQRQSGLCDPWAYEQPSFTLGDYGLEDEAIGVLTIPSIELEMPVYLGADYDHMAAGAAHLSQTSLPIGGINTNCVIAGHRGWRGASYFRYITDLQPGDTVYITNLWETLAYTVTETRIINPNDVEDILIRPGQDMLTLLTCHPYASGGKQRYVVYCERDHEYTANETEVQKAN